MQVLPSYKNQPIDLHSKSIDWFLYEGNSDIWWANHIIFSCFTVNILKKFCIITVARVKDRLVLPNEIPTGRSIPLANVEMENPPVIAVDVVRPVPTILLIAINRFIFFANLSRTLFSSKILIKYASILVNFLSNMLVSLVLLS